MTGKLRELIAWELQDNWAFPILEIVVAITIIQVMSIITYDFQRGVPDVAQPFFGSMVFVTVISVAVVFGRSFGEGIEKRKLVVLLSYPASRTKVFAAKYLANFLATLLIFGSVLFAEGLSLYMFDGVLPLDIWGFMFLYLFMAVFFTCSLMTVISVAVKRFGLSVLIFLIYVLGLQYWLPQDTHNPLAYLSLSLGLYGSVEYSYTWYHNTLNIGVHFTAITQTIFLTALCYFLVGGLVLFVASLFLMNRIDLD
jgi:ABC-type transport system involved in multi-copper enzyme maturation permease subunit